MSTWIEHPILRRPDELVWRAQLDLERDTSGLMLIDPPTGTPVKAPMASAPVKIEPCCFPLVTWTICVSSRKYCPVSIQISGRRRPITLSMYSLLDAESQSLNLSSPFPHGWKTRFSKKSCGLVLAVNWRDFAQENRALTPSAPPWCLLALWKCSHRWYPIPGSGLRSQPR